MTSEAQWREVFDLSSRYAEGIDRRDWDAFGACFAPQVVVDFSSFSHRPASLDPVPLDAWVAMVRGTIDGFPSTHHLIGNQRITFDDDSSGGYTAYVQAQHWVSRDRWYTIGGWYQNRVVRTDGAWCISAVTLHQTWDAGDRSLLREVNAR